MSREYRVWVDVEVASQREQRMAQEALEEEWNLSLECDMWAPPGQPVRFSVHGHGDGYLTGGCAPETRATDLQRAVWRALQRYVPVKVMMMRIDDPDLVFPPTEGAFDAAREAGQLDRECYDCGEPIPFGAVGDICEDCLRASEDRDGELADDGARG
ncbi:MAG: hypothetical protein WC683_01445 [bacterium]